MGNQPFRLRAVEDAAKRLLEACVVRFLRDKTALPPSMPLGSTLVLRQDHLGDMILSVPALRRLQERLQGEGRLTLVVSPSNEPFARLLFPEVPRLVYGRYPWQRLWLFARLLSGRYETLVDFHSAFSSTSALLAVLSGAKRRVGFLDEGRHREMSRAVFNDGVPASPPRFHESRKAMALVDHLLGGTSGVVGPYEMPPVSEAVRRRVDQCLQASGVREGDKLLGIHPTLNKGSNCWPMEKYVGLLDRLREVPRLKVIILYGLREERSLQRFREKAGDRPGLVFLPETGVEVLLEVAGRLDAAVMGDSGLAHLCSLRTKVLEVFGPSEPDLWSPLGPHVVFRAADRKCESVGVDEVEAEVRRTLGV